MTVQPGDRVFLVTSTRGPGRGRPYTRIRLPGTVLRVDVPGWPPGVEVRLDAEDLLPGLLPTDWPGGVCYATHSEVEPIEPA